MEKDILYDSYVAPFKHLLPLSRVFVGQYGWLIKGSGFRVKTP